VGLRRRDTELDGVVLIEPDVHRDERGFLVETFRSDELRELGIDADFVQENHSRSDRGIVRGIHLQAGQAKLVRCLQGRIWDVAVDLRADSPTYRQWEAHELDDEHHRQLFIPAGFGHGFCVLGDGADVSYKLSTYYDRALETGVAWDDPDLGIAWPITDPVLSERDRAAPRVSEITRERASG
jgi:dTDP-4-dehydrorhamnose 3,5-epimerase